MLSLLSSIIFLVSVWFDISGGAWHLYSIGFNISMDVLWRFFHGLFDLNDFPSARNAKNELRSKDDVWSVPMAKMYLRMSIQLNRGGGGEAAVCTTLR